ncbi:MAG TPA: response regulator transcription factor [Candidatus Dormibacteraeota bacterium]|nr:response regulator transcription factor [Candidatus Dormibacteraeota bacterium]
MSAAKHILIVDDEPQIGEVLGAYLQREGFSTSTAESVAQAIETVEQENPDLMILDLTLPDGSGLDVFRAVHAERALPTIMLTARSDEIDRIVGLELGADDYITKPFSPREVVARVRAVLRRSGHEPPEGTRDEKGLQVGDLVVDEQAHEVRLAGRSITVTPAEFRILLVLALHAGQVLTRAQLLDLINDEGTIYERTLDRHINNLRRKIEPDVENPTYILTVYGVGYKMRKD